MMNWLLSLSRSEKKAFAGAFLGHTVDVFDFMIYSFLIPGLAVSWHMSKAMAGSIVTWMLLASLVGAVIAGILADRYGRVRVLRWTILLFAISCFVCGLANSPAQLALWRVVQGLGFGGESSLCMVLVTEIIRDPKHRGKYSGMTASSYSFGWAAAALVYGLVYSFVPQQWAWRICLFIGILPALMVIYLRRNLHEPEIFTRTATAGRSPKGIGGLRALLTGGLFGRTVLCSFLSGGMLGGYYSIATWMPTYLRTEHGLSVTGTGSYLGVMIVGSLVGYVLGAWSTDRFGRRPTYIVFAVGAIFMLVIYMLLSASMSLALLLNFMLGILMQGMFSGVAATISEIYPSDIRATGYSVAYNVGRVIASVFPLAVGWFAAKLSLGMSIPLTAGVGYLIVIVCACLLPETNGIALEDVEVAASTGGGRDDSSSVATVSPHGSTLS